MPKTLQNIDRTCEKLENSTRAC